MSWDASNVDWANYVKSWSYFIEKVPIAKLNEFFGKLRELIPLVANFLMEMQDFYRTIYEVGENQNQAALALYFSRRPLRKFFNGFVSR